MEAHQTLVRTVSKEKVSYPSFESLLSDPSKDTYDLAWKPTS